MPVLPGDPPVEILLRRSARARRISLRVSALDGRVTLTLPRRAREADALEFARGRADWIRAAMARAVPASRVVPGCSLPVEGVLREVRMVTGRGGPRLTGDLIEMPGAPETVARRMAAFLKALARDRLSVACDRYATALGRHPSSLVLRDTRSRWGSCSSRGVVMFNWRLVMAPPEVLDYVAAHEIAHLAEMNHSPAYWRVVAGLMPDYARRRDWLRSHGNELHAWRFEPPGEGDGAD